MFESEKSELEILRERNEQEKRAFLATLFNDPEYVAAVDNLNELAEQRKRKSLSKIINRKKKDSAFRFSGTVPLERRSSSRLQKKNPLYTYEDLPDEDKFRKRRATSAELDDDLEEVVFQVRKKRSGGNGRANPPRMLPVEEVTEEMLSKIVRRGNKVYSETGTSCHQCRQKTMDTKTVCRSGYCMGVQGQFCGICIINRYGEDAATALKDPNWKCFVCRGICNCSFCRAREGKRPTGILTPLVIKQGFKSVRDYLVHLNGYGDYADLTKDPTAVLGFDDDNKAVLVDGQRVDLGFKKLQTLLD